MLTTPDGFFWDGTCKIVLLNGWAKKLEAERRGTSEKPFIFAGMGKPTFRVNPHLVEMHIKYWKAIETSIQQSSNPAYKEEEKSLAIDYGDSSGDSAPRTMMAKAMSAWYNSTITADNILFTVGGAGALRLIFESFNLLYAPHDQRYRVITPFPHYTLYATNPKHILHPVDVMKEPGYRLTAKALEESIQSAYNLAKNDNCFPKAILICNPSNPLGTVITEDEWKDLAGVMRKYPDLHIVIDEAYAEMYWLDGKIPTVLNAASDLMERLIILRSATKALSAAGERLAMLMTFSPDLMKLFREKNISCILHAPRSAQLAYAYAMENFDEKEKAALKDYYLPKQKYIEKRVKEMGAAMPDASYQIDGTFYVLCDLQDIFGEEIPKEAQRALGKRTGKIQTSEELIYSLLFKESLMVAAGSYFGLPENRGIIRITCSGNERELKDMMDRLENCLFQARKRKAEMRTELSSREIDYSEERKITESRPVEKENAQTIPEEKPEEQPKEEQGSPSIINLLEEWRKFVEDQFSSGPLKDSFLSLKDVDKMSFKPWVEHLNTLKSRKAIFS